MEKASSNAEEPLLPHKGAAHSHLPHKGAAHREVVVGLACVAAASILIQARTHAGSHHPALTIAAPVAAFTLRVPQLKAAIPRTLVTPASAGDLALRALLFNVIMLLWWESLCSKRPSATANATGIVYTWPPWWPLWTSCASASEWTAR